jgi:hypothetical protein
MIDKAVEESSRSAEGQTPVSAVVAGASPDELQTLRGKKRAAEEKFDAASAAHTSALGLGIPGFVVSLALLVACEHRIYSYAPALAERMSYGWRVAILWAMAALIAGPIYYIFFRRGYTKASDELGRVEQQFIAMRLSTEAGRKQYFREELFRLSSKAARIFFEDEQRFNVASKWNEKAGNILDGTDTVSTLSVVQSCLNSLNELVAREEQEQRDENRWQYWAIAVMVIYVGLLVGSALITNRSPVLLTTAVFGIPLSVIIWGAAGSLAAILYRFYTEQGRIRFAAEFRWLIARPIIGIIMGAVVYLALISGMILVTQNGGGAAVAAGANPPAIRMESFWIIAFLAGFSDKFYLGVIDLLVARTVRSEEVDSNTVVTHKERIPEGDQPAEKKEPAPAHPAGHQKEAIPEPAV